MPTHLLVRAILPALACCGCERGSKTLDPVDPVPADTLTVMRTLRPTRDVSVDPENRNLGLASEMRLAYPDAAALLAFDSIPAAPAGKTLKSAELILHAWSDGPAQSHVSLDAYRTGPDWQEGKGNWYYFGGAEHNGYAKIYVNFPDYLPPAGSANPADATGATWGSTAALRKDMEYISTVAAVIPKPPVAGAYPLLENTGTVVFDLTAYLLAHVDWASALSLAISRTPAEKGLNEGSTWFYSHDHAQPGAYAPALILSYR